MARKRSGADLTPEQIEKLNTPTANAPYGYRLDGKPRKSAWGRRPGDKLGVTYGRAWQNSSTPSNKLPLSRTKKAKSGIVDSDILAEFIIGELAVNIHKDGATINGNYLTSVECDILDFALNQIFALSQIPQTVA